MTFMHGPSLLLGDNTVPGVQLSKELKELIPKILKACKDWGLDFYPTVVQLLDYSEISEIAAYGGFPVRFPHWSFGMEYEELQRGYEFGAHKIYELVINSDPCYIYNLSSNTLNDHLTVVAHATGHNDFFKNNIHFSATDTNMLNKMANHGTRIRKYMARWGKEKVTEFIDWVMRIETLIDGSEAWTDRVIKDKTLHDERIYRQPRRLNVNKDRLYMEPFLNTKDFRKKEKEKVERKDLEEEIGLFKEPTKNIMGFLRDNAPLKPWQADIMSMLYEESIYFFPQRQTKVMNEGFACLRKDEYVLTENGYLKIGNIVENKMNISVYDGNTLQQITNWFTHPDKKIVKITTRRGYVLEGSETHRIIDNKWEWKRLDEFFIGDQVLISHHNDMWPTKMKKIIWKPKQFTKTLSQISVDYKIDRKDVYTIRQNKNFEKISNELKEDIFRYESELNEFGDNVSIINRKTIKVPAFVDEKLAAVFGYMCGDGHITDRQSGTGGDSFGLTTGDEEQADYYIKLLHDLFGVDCSKFWDDSSLNGRWRIIAYSKHIEELFRFYGFEKGFCARNKVIPEVIMQSPKEVMSAFLRAYFDCDGYAGTEGIILSTSSVKMVRQLQVVLLNYGILSNKIDQPKEIYHVMITGISAKKFYEEIGFGLERKQTRLKQCVIDDRCFFMKESWVDEIVSIETGFDTVYDITVENTHRYAAQGFINHNSTVDSVIMAEQGFVSLGQKSHDCGIVEYAEHKSGVLGGKYSMNPYKLGYYLFKDIRTRWDKGQFGTEWDECTNIHQKENWDTKAGLGKEKIFEVRKYYDDFSFLHEFFTEDFCREQEYFEWKHYPNGEFRIESRDYKKIKHNLMRRHLNGGIPDIRLTEPNYRGKGSMFLQHYFDGRGLYSPYINDVMVAIRAIWGQDVYLATQNEKGEEKVYGCYGTDSTSDVELLSRKDHLKRG